MWNTPTLPACLLSQANITQSACVVKQSESQWLVMVTLPDRTTVLVTSHPSIHFLLKIVAVVETLDGFMDPLTLISFSFFGVYWRELNFYELFYFCGHFFFFIVCSDFCAKKPFWGWFQSCPPETRSVLKAIQRKFHLTSQPIYFSIREIKVGSVLIQIKPQ